MSCLGKSYDSSFGNKDAFNILSNASVSVCNSNLRLNHLGGNKKIYKKNIKNKTSKTLKKSKTLKIIKNRIRNKRKTNKLRK
jgi:hypothetical protein